MDDGRSYLSLRMKTSSLTLRQRIDRFWFRPVSAAGFGMMRVSFGLIGFVTMLFEATNVQRYYGPEGILPHDLIPSVMRSLWRFSLLDHASADTVTILYVALLIGLLCVALGIGTRIVLALTLVLLYSFHEYGSITLDGGDTLMRLIGFILLLAPSYRTFTIPNLFKRLKSIRLHGKDQSVALRTMAIWPYRLLLWQMICLYLSSSIEKLHGTLWYTGSAVAIALQHDHFRRLPDWLADKFSLMSPAIGYFTLITQIAWGLLIVIPLLAWIGIKIHGRNTIKRTLLLCGVFVHMGILFTMDVGTFSFTVFAAYLGLLLDDDFVAMRHFFNRHMKRLLVVLFDGRCGFCKRTVFLLHMIDWLHRIDFVNLYDADLRKKYAPHISLEALEKEMHAVDQDGKATSGFFAFRTIAKNIPALWIFVPFLYLPLVPTIGIKIYGWIARHR